MKIKLTDDHRVDTTIEKEADALVCKEMILIMPGGEEISIKDRSPVFTIVDGERFLEFT